MKKLPELQESVRSGRLYVARPPLSKRGQANSTRVPDGKVCLNETGELAVTKFAVEPVRPVLMLCNVQEQPLTDA